MVFPMNMTIPMNMMFSTTNSNMVSSNPWASFSLSNDLWSAKMGANSVAYLVPDYSAQFMANTNWCTNLIFDFENFIKAQQFSWNMGGGNLYSGNNSLINFGNWNFTPWTPWNNNNSTGSNSNAKLTDAEKLEQEKQKEQIAKLTDVLKKIQEVAQDDLTDDQIAKIKLALSKSSSNVKEKLDALKDAYKDINTETIKKVMPLLSNAKDTNQILQECGFNFSMDKFSYDVNNSDTISIEDIHQSIAGIDNDHLTESQIANVTEVNILKVISKWNDTYNDNDSRSIIRFVNSQINKLSEDNDKKNKKDAVSYDVQPLVTALQHKSDSVIDKCKSSLTNESIEAIKSQSSALTSVYEKAHQDPTSDNLNKLSDEFEKLYLMLRKASVLQAQKDMSKYVFINDIVSSGTDEDIITNELFENATEADLEKEGLKSKYKDIDMTKKATPQQQKSNANNSTVTVDILKTSQDSTTVQVKLEGFTMPVDAYKYHDHYYQIDRNDNVKDITNSVTEEVSNASGTPAPINQSTELPTLAELQANNNKPVSIQTLDEDGNWQDVENTNPNVQYYEYQGKLYKVKNNTVEKELPTDKYRAKPAS